MERSAARVIKAVTHVDLELKDEQEVVDVCQAWEEMREDMRIEGRKEGRKEGLKEGLKEGQRNAQIAVAQKLVEKKMFSIEEISELSGLTLEDVKTLVLKCED